jgi:HEAT repeat protein
MAAWAVWSVAIPSSLLYAQDPATRPMMTVGEQVQALRAPNFPAADRDEAARRLVADRSPAAKQAIRDILVDLGSRRGQLAIARALATAVDPDPEFANELFLLAGTEAPNNEAAIQALSNYRMPEVRNRLIDLARDPNHQQRDTTRTAAIAAVGTYSDKNAAQALLSILSSDAESSAIRKAAAGALAQLSGVRGNGEDVAKWQQWWNENSPKNDAQFENDLLQARAARFNRWQRRYDRMVDETASLLSDAYRAVPEKSREALLLRYLKSEAAETRVAGVRIVHDEFSLRQPISDAVRAQLRAMIGDSSTDVRIEVARSLEELNDATALDSLINQLHQEPDPDVRRTLVDALVTIQDVGKVVPELIRSLNDESPTVASAAATGLARLGPMVREKNPNLAPQVAQAIQTALQSKAQGPGTAAFRATLIDALAPLRIPELRSIFIPLLQQNQPVPVRAAAARALGELQQSWAADTLVNSLDDPDPAVRGAVLDALKLCATFEHAERIYAVLKNRGETDAVREKAWAALETLFPKAEPAQLARWADRFLGDNEHARRYIILKQEADQLRQRNNLDSLADVQQNIGKELMAMDRPDEAAVQFDLALAHHQAKGGPQVTIEVLSEQRMDALLESAQYQKACDFAASVIASNQGNQQPMGIRLRNKVDRLRQKGDYDGALTLIAAIKKMQPQLAEQFMSYIQQFEDEIRKANPERVKSSGPQPTNAVGAAPATQ